MKITFPHMGNTYIPVKGLCDDLGIDVIIPPKNSKKTLELGTKYAPESICLPMKITLGNYLQSIEKGADTIIFVGTCGPCRFGYYSEVQKEILKDLGYDIEFIVFESEAPAGSMKNFYNQVSKIINTKNIFKIINSFKNSFEVLRKINKFEEYILKLRPYEKNKGEIDQLYRGLIHNLEKSNGSKNMIKLIDNAQKNIEDIEIDKDRNVLKVAIVGEIYMIIEDFANLDIGKKLNEMGVEVHKTHTTSEWTLESILINCFSSSKEKNIHQAANEYMKTMIGGHARETIGNSVIYANKGYDGIIQVMPFTCMPEIVAMSILPKIQNEHNIPILSLIIDEMTGEAGYLTRLEAYIDLLRNRKEKHEDERVLSWN